MRGNVNEQRTRAALVREPGAAGGVVRNALCGHFVGSVGDVYWGAHKGISSSDHVRVRVAK